MTERKTATQNQEQIRGAWDSIATGYVQFSTPKNMSSDKEAIDRIGLCLVERIFILDTGNVTLNITPARQISVVLTTILLPVM